MRSISLTIEEVDLPESVDGVSTERQPGEYVIFINGNKDNDAKSGIFLHEMLHVWHGDHDNDMDTDELELIRHEELKRILTDLTEKRE